MHAKQCQNLHSTAGISYESLSLNVWSNRNLTTKEIINHIIDRTIDEADGNSRRNAHKISVEVVNDIIENATASLEVQLGNLKIDTDDEMEVSDEQGGVEALPSPPITTNTMYVPVNTICQPVCTWGVDDNNVEMTGIR